MNENFLDGKVELKDQSGETTILEPVKYTYYNYPGEYEINWKVFGALPRPSSIGGPEQPPRVSPRKDRVIVREIGRDGHGENAPAIGA